MASSNYEENYSTERILDFYSISDINTEDGRGSSPYPFRDSHLNQLIIEGQPIQDSSESNDSDSEGFMSDNFRININGTPFHFLREFHMVFHKLFFSCLLVESPFNPKEILREHLKYRNCFVEQKRNRESMESITSTQRIVTHILSIMPADARQKLAGRIPTKDLAPRSKTGPSRCFAQRPHPTRRIASNFFSCFMERPESRRNLSIDSQDEFPRQWTRAEQIQGKDPKSTIGNLTIFVLKDLKIIKAIADFTLRQYESGVELDLKKTLKYLMAYHQAEGKDSGTKEEIFEELALMVANDCEKYLQSTFKILDLRNLLNIYEKSRSRIQYAIFLMKVHTNIDAEVNEISMNIRSLVQVARSFLMKERREV